MFEEWETDPVHAFLDDFSLVAVIVVLCVAWRYRQRVLVLVTGDDRIHATGLDFVWWFFCRCCGTCTGDWTVPLTRDCCWCLLPEGPERMRGLNVVNEVGRYFGLADYTVELKNVVVGDLPSTGPGEFFLQVECEANPPINTSVSQSKQPKVVHFPEVVRLHLRSSRWFIFEQQVRITVRELGLLGSTEVCSVIFRACDIVDRSHMPPTERTMRVEMKISDRSKRAVTAPWIYLEFDESRDIRDLDHFHGDQPEVRMALRSGLFKEPVADFKHNYHLLDESGDRMQEPSEQDLAEIHKCRRRVVCKSRFCSTVVGLLVVTCLCAWAYVKSCHKRYMWIAMAKGLKKKFPISNYDLFKVVESCEQELDGTGTAWGTDPCRPTYNQTACVCLWDFPERQPRPVAFRAFVQRRLGWQISGVPCWTPLCEHFGIIAPMADVVCICGCTLLVISALVCRCRARDEFYRYKQKQTWRTYHEEFVDRRDDRSTNSSSSIDSLTTDIQPACFRPSVPCCATRREHRWPSAPCCALPSCFSAPREGFSAAARDVVSRARRHWAPLFWPAAVAHSPSDGTRCSSAAAGVPSSSSSSRSRGAAQSVISSL
jgi:hypothetical protein